jgi:hypothetical protein
MSAPDEVKGRLWKVEVTRTQSAYVYVLADSANEAQADAIEVVEDQDFFGMTDDDTDAINVIASQGQRVWSGGPDGQWTGPFEGA